METYSSLDQFLSTHGATFVEIEDQKLPLRYSETILNEVEAIQKKAALLDMKAFQLIRMHGPEALKFLQGLVSNDLDQNPVGGLQHHLLSNHKGKILFELSVYRESDESLILLCNASEGRYVGGYIDHYHIREELEMELLNPEWVRCDVLGPLAQNALKQLGASEPTWEFKEQTIHSIPSPVGQVERWINLIPFALYQDFLDALLPHAELVGFDAFDQIRIHEGQPRVGIDFSRENFPQEAALMDHISYSKGCYIGQETHARMYHRGHPNWQLVAIEMPESVEVEAGQELFYEEAVVGKITSLSSLNAEGHQRGIAFLKYNTVSEKHVLSPQAASPAVIQQKPLLTAQVG